MSCCSNINLLHYTLIFSANSLVDTTGIILNRPFIIVVNLNLLDKK